MTSPDGLTFSGDIPGQPNGTIHYFRRPFKAADICAVPLGGPLHPFTVFRGRPPSLTRLKAEFDTDNRCDWNLWGLTARAVSTGNLSITDSPILIRRSANSFRIYFQARPKPGRQRQFPIPSKEPGRRRFLHVEAASDSTDWIRLNSSSCRFNPDLHAIHYDLAQLVGQPDVRVRFHLLPTATAAMMAFSHDAQ
jgi:hypothetical protein